jgi:repressor LexA
MTDAKRRLGRKPSAEISEPQRRAFWAIREHMTQRGIPPTMQELGKALGMSAAGAHDLTKQLIRKGILRRDGRRARSLTIIRDPECIDGPWEHLIALPLLGVAAAGRPLLAEENRLGEVLVESRAIGSGPHFALRISGDSMIGAGINDGDVVIVRQQPLAQHGEIVVALLRGEATVKRLHHQGDRIELRPENPRLAPIAVDPGDDLRIVGRVVGVRRAR